MDVAKKFGVLTPTCSEQVVFDTVHPSIQWSRLAGTVGVRWLRAWFHQIPTCVANPPVLHCKLYFGAFSGLHGLKRISMSVADCCVFLCHLPCDCIWCMLNLELHQLRAAIELNPSKVTSLSQHVQTLEISLLGTGARRSCYKVQLRQYRLGPRRQWARSIHASKIAYLRSCTFMISPFLLYSRESRST